MSTFSGGLSPERRESLAQRYFESAEFFKEVEAYEEDLINSYLRGDLTSRDRHRFEDRFLAIPELRARVDEARALREALQAVVAGPSDRGEGAPVRPVWRRVFRWLSWGLAAAAALCLVWFGGTLRSRWMALSSEVTRLETELAQQRVRLESLAVDAGEGFRISVGTLTSRAVRSSGGRNVVILESGTRLVRLRLVIRQDPSYAAYRASLRSAEGVSEEQQLWMQDGLEPHIGVEGRIIEILLPSSVLLPGDYLLSLEGHARPGFERVETFQFRAIRQ